jgi:hypothetical protein
MAMYLRADDERLGSEPTAGAARFERILETELPRGFRLPVAAAGAAALLGSIAVFSARAPWAVFGMIAGAGALVAGATGGRRTDRYEPAPDGDFVLAPPEVEAAVLHEQWLHPFSIPTRILAGFVGLLFVAILALNLAGLRGLHRQDAVGILIPAALAASLLYLAFRGNTPLGSDPAELPLPPRFHELADPRRPLPPDALPPPPASTLDRV